MRTLPRFYWATDPQAEYQAAIACARCVTGRADTRPQRECRLSHPKLAAIPGITPVKPYPGVTRLSYYMYPFIYDETEFNGLSRAAFVKALAAEGVPASPGYPKYPIYTQEFIREMFQTEVYRKFYSSQELDWEAYKARNACPGLMGHSPLGMAEQPGSCWLTAALAAVGGGVSKYTNSARLRGFRWAKQSTLRTVLTKAVPPIFIVGAQRRPSNAAAGQNWGM